MDCENRCTLSTSSSVSLKSLDSGLSSRSLTSSSPEFSDAEKAFLYELALLNNVIDRILPIVNHNPEEKTLSAVCDLAGRLIASSGCSLGPRTYYVFSNLYRETAALETRPCLAQRATTEVVAYIRKNFQEQQKKRKRQQQQAKKAFQIVKHFGQELEKKEEEAKELKEELFMEQQLSIVIKVLNQNIANPLCSAFAPLFAALRELDLLNDEDLVSLFVFTAAESKLMMRACSDKDDDNE